MSREMKSGNVLSAMRYTSAGSFESGRASGRSFTMAGLHARGGDRPVDGTLQHLKGEGVEIIVDKRIQSSNLGDSGLLQQWWRLRARALQFSHAHCVGWFGPHKNARAAGPRASGSIAR